MASGAAAIRRSAACARGRVLVVDDEPSLVRAYGRLLNQAGFEVELAPDGETAVDVFRRGGIDAVFTDIAMPGMDGVALLRAIRSEDGDMPVVLATGGPTVESAIEALDLGALRYLVKPVDPKELLSVVERAMQLSRLATMKRQALALLEAEHVSETGLANLATAFERAVQGLYVHYQPIVCWSAQRVFGYEALARSCEPSLAGPGPLFEAAERLTRVVHLGRNIRTIATQAPLGEGELLFLNLHPADLGDEELLDPASPVVAMADRVVLEITERASLSGIADVRSRIAALRERGFRIAVDDLGAGYSGLATFALLEPEVAKLDMGLVRDVDRSPTKQRLVRSMCDLSWDMGLTMIAEGVETTAERDTLIELGCDLFQGFLFARPGANFPSVRW